ncbi:MAG: PDZ domain-containing protein [Acidobacteria bacterium]|nr:PDZ domain-containing protein [Acidobacteriota bacterium]
MRCETILLTSTLMLAGFSGQAAAQVTIHTQGSFPGDVMYLVQAAPPQPPAAPAAPLAPMGDLIRLMSSNGSYLGVGVRDVDADRKKALNLKEERGAEITSVEEDSPAAKAGLKTGDVVLDYAGNRVESIEQFIRLVRETPAGREVKMTVSRAGSLTTLTAKPESGRNRMQSTIRIAPLPQIAEIRGMIGSMDSPRAVMYWKSGQLGVEAESLDSQLAEFFGVKQGVLVRAVTNGSAAEKAGVKAGDVIVKVEDSPVGSPREVTSAVKTARGNSGKTVGLTVVRDKKEVAMKVTFEDEPAPAAPLPRSRSIQNKMQEF